MTAVLEKPATSVQPLGPGSIHWRFTGDWRMGLLSGRALAFQTAYPAVGGGVGEHSVYRTDPWGRLDRTFRSVLAQVYGGPATVEEGRRLQELHRAIKGIDGRGRRYSALHPEAYLWVHATTYEAALVFFERFDTPLTEAETDQLFDEWRRIGLLLGIRDQHLPASQAEFWEMWERVCAKLENNAVVQDIMFNPPFAPPRVPSFLWTTFTRRYLRTRRLVIAGTVSTRMREVFGLPELTTAEQARLDKLGRTMRRLGRVLPDRLRFLPLARKARRTALRGAA